MEWIKKAYDDGLRSEDEIYLPESHLPAMQKALQSVDAGHIGNYDSCIAYSRD